MPPSRPSLVRALRASLLGIIFAGLVLSAPRLTRAAGTPDIFPLDQVKPGMKGTAYTIFSGDQIHKIDLVVLGVLPDLMGPKQSIILVQLMGPEVEHTGVVAGMSGSPVYIDGKLVGALSLKFGQFTREPLAGVTPIQNMLDIAPADTQGKSANRRAGTNEAPASQIVGQPQYAVPADALSGGLWPKTEAGLLNSGAYLTPIDTPLVFTGASAATVAHFASQFAAYGMVATQGGAGVPQPDDANLKPGDMVSMELVRGDSSLGASCTVTAIINNRIYACGHPVLGMGAVSMPMSRARVVTTLASDMDSIKIVTTGGVIGTFTDDRLTAIAGTLGAGPRMIPMDLSLDTPAGHREFHFELADNPRLTPLLVGAMAYNGLVSNTAYSEGTTLQLSGDIDIAGHSSVHIANMFAPSDAFVPDGTFVAVTVQSLFSRVFTNPYETPKIDRIRLKLESLPERRVTAIDGAWTDVTEAQPGDTVTVKVLLRPYRGEPELRNLKITVPAEADPGTTLRIQVSDAGWLNRTTRSGAAGAGSELGGLEQLIHVLNEERQNNRLYVTLLKPTPTLLVEDKELPNAPLSEMNVLDQRRGAGLTVLRESVAGEWSVPMDSVVSGAAFLTIHVK
jgi:hypothetical protein